MKEVIILGSTGSIGVQALNVIRKHFDKFKVVGLACGKNYQLLKKQIAEFHPKYVYLDDVTTRCKLELNGAELLPSTSELASRDCDIVLTAQVGVGGVLPTIAAINAGHNIALANKETLACCGDLIMALAAAKGVKILPVDSEHSAIWQCLTSGKKTEVKKLILTASGGAFRGKTRAELEGVTVADALRHPTWSMGAKVTIDSASLMNKGLEIIEAMHLFAMRESDIEVIAQKESIIHSMVEYVDNSVIAQMSLPSMELPIQLALTYPDRVESTLEPIDFAKLGELHFEPVDMETFRCLKIARQCAKLGGLYPCVMNACNEIAVAEFIGGRIRFLDIPRYIESAIGRMNVASKYTFDEALAADKLAREIILSEIARSDIK